MCDLATRTVIEQVSSNFVQQGRQFTAWDVTKEVRSQGVREKHNEIKKVVHELFSNGNFGSDYTRSVRQLPNQVSGQPAPFIYHRNYEQPDDYVNAQVSASSDDEDDDKSSKSSFSVDDHDDGCYKVDKRSRICIPKQLLFDIGIGAGDTVGVVFDSNSSSLLITKDTKGTDVLTNYKVDSYGNVRISQATLQKVGLGGNVYDIDGDTDKVFVKVHN